MWRNIYLAAGVAMIVGYLGWTWLGWELGSSARDPVPTVYVSTGSGSGYGRSSGGYYGTGSGWGWGK